MWAVLTLALAAPLPPERTEVGPPKCELFAKADWYVRQNAKEEEFVGVVERAPEPGGVGFGRVNPYLLKMEKETRELYAGNRPDLLAIYQGKKVKVVGKAVDMEVEGKVHHEIWPARLELVKEAPAKVVILADHKLYKMEPAQEKDSVGVLRKGEKDAYYLELTAGKAVGREDLLLYSDAGDPLAPYVGKRVRIHGKQVTGAVGMRTFQHTLPGTLEVLPEEKPGSEK